MLNGLFDIDNRLDYLTENGDMLPRLKELVPWEKFRRDLEVIYDHDRKSNAGRRPFDVVMMFKILILQSLYNLSDDEHGISNKEIHLLKIGATRRSGRRTRMPAGFRRTGRITTATRTMLRRMSITKSFGITKLRMPPFTTAMCLKSFSMKATPAGMFMRTARIVPRRARRI